MKKIIIKILIQIQTFQDGFKCEHTSAKSNSIEIGINVIKIRGYFKEKFLKNKASKMNRIYTKNKKNIFLTKQCCLKNVDAKYNLK